MTIDDTVQAQQQRAIAMMTYYLEKGLTLSEIERTDWCHVSGGFTYLASLFDGSIRTLVQYALEFADQAKVHTNYRGDYLQRLQRGEWLV